MSKSSNSGKMKAYQGYCSLSDFGVGLMNPYQEIERPSTTISAVGCPRADISKSTFWPRMKNYGTLRLGLLRVSITTHIWNHFNSYLAMAFQFPIFRNIHPRISLFFATFWRILCSSCIQVLGFKRHGVVTRSTSPGHSATQQPLP